MFTLIAVGVACFSIGFLTCLVLAGWASRRKTPAELQPKEYRSNR